MPEATENFSLAGTLSAAGDAFVAVICRIGFQAGVHGLIVGAIVLAVGLIQTARATKYGKPLLSVARKLGIFCSLLALPGIVCLISTGTLPQVNSLELNSVGLLGFWSLVVLHLCMEEMNFQWFAEGKHSGADEEAIDEGEPVGVVEK